MRQIAFVLLGALVFGAGLGYGQQDAVMQERLGTTPKWVLTVVWSTTGSGCRLAWVAKGEHGVLVAVDGQPGPEYDGILGGPVFSPDSKRVAYVAGKGDKQLIVIDGQPGPEYDSIGEGTLVFSPDSKRVAYGAGKGNKQLIVIDGQPGPEYDGILKGSLVFSPDSKRVAYGARKGNKWFVVIDGQPGPEYDVIATVLAVLQDGTVEYLAISKGVLFRVRHRH